MGNCISFVNHLSGVFGGAKPITLAMQLKAFAHLEASNLANKFWKVTGFGTPAQTPVARPRQPRSTGPKRKYRRRNRRPRRKLMERLADPLSATLQMGIP